MEPLDAALAALAPSTAAGLLLEHDADEVRLVARVDLLHLDADALHDRLHHWTIRVLDREIPAARAYLSFRHAHPADPAEASTLDLQEGWLALEPTLELDLRVARPGDAARLAARLPEFLALVGAAGRPAGWRRHDVGSLE